MLDFTTIAEGIMARSNTNSARKPTRQADSRKEAGAPAIHIADGTRQRAAGGSVARAGGASKRSCDVIRQVSIDRRDAIRELANR